MPRLAPARRSPLCAGAHRRTGSSADDFEDDARRQLGLGERALGKEKGPGSISLLLTNPHDPYDLVEKCYYALAINRAEAEGRLRELFGIVQHNDIHRWGQDFLDVVGATIAARTAPADAEAIADGATP